uniref:RRM domain-containing protein n=1 Tax=Ditylenchus dipsaci TaxID=166011 RepID=A0A915D6W7_9BILA
MEEEKIGNFTSRGPGIKSWRIIIRNLPFDTKTEDVQELAKAFGSIKEVKLPKCKDTKFPDSCAGFCFVQFATRKEAEAARENLNFTEFKKRKVAVDWAIDKDRYVTKTTEARERKQASNPQKTVFREEEQSDTEDEKEASYAESSNKEEEEEESDDDESDSDASMDTAQKEPRKEDVAISEGRVVFLRNIDLALPIHLLRKRQANQPTGTAFVHFAQKDSADAFLDQLASEEGVEINGRKIFGHRAVPKSDADSLKKIMQSSRRISEIFTCYVLLSYGLVPLKLVECRLNLHMFVSPTRLAIHNVPFSYNDEKLREVSRSGPEGALYSRAIKRLWICEFSNHTDALVALRFLNNNAEIFTDDKRPIVEFSIENLQALKIKEMRAANIKNPQQFSKKKEWKPAALTVKESSALAATKRELMAGGKKWLPKKFGEKVRHKNTGQKKVLKPKKTIVKKSSVSELLSMFLLLLLN